MAAAQGLSRDPISLVESVYELEPRLDPWLQRLAESVQPHLDCGYGTQAVVYCPAQGLPQPVRIVGMGLAGTPPEMRASLERTLPNVQPEQAEAMWQRPMRLQTFSELAPASYRSFFADDPAALGGRPVKDFKAVLSTDGPDWLLLAGGYSPRWERTTPSEQRLWQRIATHITVSARLMWALDRGADPSEEAVLEPAGKLLNATGEARDATARDRLREAARAMDRARGRLRRDDPMLSLELWRGLVDGRWSLVDRFESDGRRFLVALRNDSPLRDPRSLSRRQAQVAHFVALGLSNKEIAYALGLSESVVGTHVSATLRKMKLRRREELAAEIATREVRTSSGRIGSVEIGVASRRAEPLPPSAGLSSAEEEVVRAVLGGRSDAAIARERGRSPRTVANQLRSAFRKLGVKSRAELVAKLSRSAPK